MQVITWTDRRRAVIHCAMLHYLTEINPRTPSVKEWFGLNVGRYATVAPGTDINAWKSPMYKLSSDARAFLKFHHAEFERAALRYFATAMQERLFSMEDVHIRKTA